MEILNPNSIQRLKEMNSEVYQVWWLFFEDFTGKEFE